MRTPEELIETLDQVMVELEQAQGALETSVLEYAESENAYRLARSRSFLGASGTVAEREAITDRDTSDERYRAHLGEARMKAMVEAVRNRRQQVSAWQSAAALVKSELGMAAYGPEVAP